MSLIEESAFDLVAKLRSGELRPTEVAASYCDRIEQFDGGIRSFLRFDRDYCLGQAEELERSGLATDSALAGLPIAIKDVICIKDEITSCASKMLAEFRSPYDATVSARLKSAYGVVLGKTNMDEFAMGSSTENSAFAKTRNPWDFDHVPGGSSGGAATCVAASMAPLSLGSDTGGSVRQPAAFCGVTGLKPTYGRISRYGLVAFASSLDQIGILARDARDVALLLNVVAGHDPHDSTSAKEPVADYLNDLSASVRGLKIGVPRNYFGEGLTPEIETSVREACRVFESLGATMVDIDLPLTDNGIATYYLIASCEASGNLARYDGAHYGFRAASEGSADSTNRLLEMYCQTRSQGFGAEVKRRIMLGTYALSSGYYEAYYLRALKVRRLIQGEVKRAFSKVDLILGPTTPTPAYRFGDKKDPLAMYLGDVYTVIANLAGIPAISFPGGFTDDSLPIGIQLQGPAFQEARLLRATWAFQQETDWHHRRPKSRAGEALPTGEAS